MALPIEDYAIIADTQTAALVGRNGSIDWLCVPRFDSGAIFAALLGEAENGHWTIAPSGEVVTTRRRYRDDTLVLETEFETAGGVARLIDFMPPRTDSPSVIRIVEGVRGQVDFGMELRLRFDYGHVVPWVYREGGALVAVAGPDAAWLRTDVPTRGENLTTKADFRVRAGERAAFTLTWRPSHLPSPAPLDPAHELGVTEGYWRGWVSACTYEGEWRDAVVRSLLTLKALTYAPTGGIVAAATTSLPEKLGGVRNWDYRFCWLRDATITLQSLLFSGFQSEAIAWRKWLLRAIAGNPAELQIMYGVAGERRLDEYLADWLTGYDGNPVRIGNAAAEQFQLDVYGEVMDALHQGRRAGLKADDPSWGLQVKLMEFVEEHWQDPDEGIWEVRGGPRQFTHSKLMAWVAADRAVKAVEEFGLDGPADRWRRLRDEIRQDILDKGYDPVRKTFTQYYGSDELDAAMLMVPLVGFLPGDDERVAGTVAAIEQHLLVDGFVQRYTQHPDADVDGLPPGEGAFLACTFWLADNYALMGRHDEARETFARLLALRNDVGLLAEEYDTTTGRLVGNFPQAFSHVPLIDTARTLTSALAPTEARASEGLR
ncbi:glucoamylase [Actinoplanes sp. SE50]|uniref:glycoside hydrolase family 15 protein n=1 Tax=unclassified Actinoplanes TaxID=2626549 RepID=UPI00023EBEAC|nr:MULTISPECIES: glycoside hydrolase family 15 protein [unclassified Actinoplanes]AEV82922.1 glycoside hydrolase 15-related protein [Actinoplanes sp. SE50/110]ATO81318.1 glucoamylase [Actinoplanes sp. SE50]SLL98725.1 glucoamylase [Actinoplanes sp. SE50/110]